MIQKGEKRPNFETTTFNMWVHLKEKGKMYVAHHNRQVNEKNSKDPKINLGILLNKALDYYLDDIKLGE